MPTVLPFVAFGPSPILTSLTLMPPGSSRSTGAAASPLPSLALPSFACCSFFSFFFSFLDFLVSSFFSSFFSSAFFSTALPSAAFSFFSALDLGASSAAGRLSDLGSASSLISSKRLGCGQNDVMHLH